MLRVNVAHFVRNDCKHFIVAQSLDQLRIEHDDRTFDAACKCVDDRILLHEEFGHVYAECGAGDLKLGVEIRALRWGDFNGARSEDDANGRLTCDGQKFLKGRVDSRDRAQSGECTAVGWMDVLVLVESRELFVGDRPREANGNVRSVLRRRPCEFGCADRNSDSEARGCY